MSTYVLGDLHGCHTELVHLMESLSFTPERDQLWLVGDLVNRGPDSLACLREVMALGNSARCVLGNHDLHLLVAARGGGKLGKNDTLDGVLSAVDREALLDWLMQQPLALASGNTLMVHAGILPDWHLVDALHFSDEVTAALGSESGGMVLRHLYGNQPDRWDPQLEGMERLRCLVNVMTRMRFINAQGRLDFTANKTIDSAPVGYAPWFQFPRADEAHLVFGHWAALQGHAPQAASDVDALDTGCAWGGALTALELDTGKRHAVMSQRHG